MVREPFEDVFVPVNKPVRKTTEDDASTSGYHTLNAGQYVLDLVPNNIWTITRDTTGPFIRDVSVHLFCNMNVNLFCNNVVFVYVMSIHVFAITVNLFYAITTTVNLFFNLTFRLILIYLLPAGYLQSV